MVETIKFNSIQFNFETTADDQSLWVRNGRCDKNIIESHADADPEGNLDDCMEACRSLPE